MYGLYDTIQKLAENDTAILVRDMASKLIKSCEEYDRLGKSGGKRRMPRRTSATHTPPSLFSTQSMPPTPTSARSSHSTTYFVDRDSRRSFIHTPLPFRSTDREEISSIRTSNVVTNGTGSGPSSAVTKSRLPRTTSGRNSRQSIVFASPGRDENYLPSPTIQAAPLTTISNSRRRRLAGGEGRGT